MKITMKITLVIAVVLVLAGILGTVFTQDSKFNAGVRNWNVFGKSDTGEKIDLATLEENVGRYIERYGDSLVIGDIFVFEDSDYYFSIMEEKTGLGAMELLVNPYTGYVYPEYGPNMMWNLKYGMHGGFRGAGMMGGRGIFTANGFIITNSILKEDAHAIAKEYIESKVSEGYTIPIEGHEFYGYYTFHTEKENETTGMLSVNGITGDVWYHDWHGTVTEIIDGHED